MTTHELLSSDCMSFTEWHEVSIIEIETFSKPAYFEDWERVHHLHTLGRKFLTQPLTPEWVEKYLEGFKWTQRRKLGGQLTDVLSNNGIEYWKESDRWWLESESLEPKHVSYFFESLPPEIKLKYKNVEI